MTHDCLRLPRTRDAVIILSPSWRVPICHNIPDVIDESDASRSTYAIIAYQQNLYIYSIIFGYEKLA